MSPHVAAILQDPGIIAELQQLLLVNVAVILLVIIAAAGIVVVLVRRGMEQRVEAERLHAMGLATARILHQVKNPLQAIMLNAELLADETIADDPALRREACESIVAGADMMSELLADLSAYASGVGRRLNSEVFPLHEVAVEAVRVQTEAAERAGLTLRLDVRDEVAVHADPYFLRQALDNVIRNAREALLEASADGSTAGAAHADGAGEIEVRVGRSGEHALVEVRDDGPGIAPDRLDTVVQPFVTTKGKGMGLGLAITRDIVEGHGGRVEIRSRPGAGTTVAFRLPALSAASTPEPA
ncbi:MAG: sensor histidine kinase [Gemmatimonadota bacterium]